MEFVSVESFSSSKIWREHLVVIKETLIELGASAVGTCWIRLSTVESIRRVGLSRGSTVLGQTIVILNASLQSLEDWALSIQSTVSTLSLKSLTVTLGDMLLDNILKTLVGLDHLHNQVSLVDFDVLKNVLAEDFVFAGNSAVKIRIFDMAHKNLGTNAVKVINHMLDRNGDSILVNEIFDQTLHFRAHFSLEFDWGVGEKVFTLLVQVMIGNTELSLIFLVQLRDVPIVIINSVKLSVGSGLLASSGFGDQEFSFFFSKSSQSDSLTLFIFEAKHELVSIIIV